MTFGEELLYYPLHRTLFEKAVGILLCLSLQGRAKRLGDLRDLLTPPLADIGELHPTSEIRDDGVSSLDGDLFGDSLTFAFPRLISSSIKYQVIVITGSDPLMTEIN